MFQYPCKDCHDRSVQVIDNKVVRCHSTCPKYLEARAAHTKKTTEILEAKKVEDGIDDYQVRVAMETKKRFEKRR